MVAGSRIKLSDPLDVSYWTQELDVDEAWLMEAVEEVGPCVADVRRHLELVRKPKSRRAPAAPAQPAGRFKRSP